MALLRSSSIPPISETSMPGAGFYSIHTSRISFRTDGRWYADDDPVVHQRLALLFSRHVRRKPAGPGYEIWIDERYHADVEVEDTPFVVTTVDAKEDGTFLLQLNDGSSELLDPYTLTVCKDGSLSCAVKQASERARFLRPAHYQLAESIEEGHDGRFQLRCGAGTVPIVGLH